MDMINLLITHPLAFISAGLLGLSILFGRLYVAACGRIGEAEAHIKDQDKILNSLRTEIHELKNEQKQELKRCHQDHAKELQDLKAAHTHELAKLKKQLAKHNSDTPSWYELGKKMGGDDNGNH